MAAIAAIAVLSAHGATTAAPADPTGLSATAGDSEIALAWNANAEPDLAGYKLYRDTSSPVSTSGTPVNGTDLITGTAYTDMGLSNGQIYYYALVAVDSSNNSSGASGEASATPQQAVTDPVFVGAGDIADCTRTQDSDTGDLIEAIPGSVFTIGDNAYQNGTAAEFQCYDDAWGAFKDRTRPTLGNHDFGNGTNPGAPDYFDYFNGSGQGNGDAGPRPDGYYSYDLSGNGVTWHVVVLNSECEPSTGWWLPGGCAAASTQEQWLRTDLANASTNNIIAMWHKPRWSSAGNHSHMAALYQALYDNGVDIVLGGHWHNYERLAPTDPSGNLDTTYGLRNFTIGTGGASLSGFGTLATTSEVRDSSTYGVMKFTLHASSYDWQFIPIASQSGTFSDSGTTAVHSAPPDTTNPTVTIVSAVPSTLGPADTSTDVTWNADEDGSYSLRIGGTDCATGTQVDSGSYTSAPADVVTTVQASDLAEGANTIRVCVTNAATNTGSDTTSVTKDSTAPTVTIVSAVPSSLGPSDTSTDLTWNANENGTYSVRVGGTDCATGTQVDSGSYTSAPADVVTTVQASDLAEGANTIRACVTDSQSNTGSDTTSVSKDSTAPTVTTVSALPATVGASGSTDVTWNANEEGTYSVRVGGTDCSSGTEVANGSYTSAPADQVTTVQASDLAEGANTIRVCVTNAATNTGSDTTSVTKDSTAPTVSIVSALPSTLGLSDTSTDLTWQADENGSYSVRLGGTDCSSGTELDAGSYTAPGNQITNVSATALGEGANTIRVCVTDAATNTGSDTTSVSKDSTAPTVTIVSALPSTLGPADTSTDVTWNADEDGSYSLRIGGTDCSSGTELEAGSYTSAPADQVTTVQASDLAEGANTIRTCVTDSQSNTGSDTTTLTKDTTAPTVTIVSAAPSAVGASGSTDITWQADENGSYSLRVGGTDCSSGTELEAGSYTSAPADLVTTVQAADLAEGANTIRACVTDAATNTGSDTTSVSKDSTAPTVTIVSAVPSTLGASGSTDITWHADEDGSYSLRIGGTDCATGTQVDSGSYTSAPADVVTTVQASDLAEGANTIRVCVTDAATNTGSDTTSVSKDSTAPTVTIVSAVPATVGASGSTDVTWNATEDGTYSVRVGGTDCSSGTEVANGSYTSAPADQVTTVQAGDLAEGANTIRACVTDSQSNTGSDTTSVSKDSTAPTVTIVSAVPATVGASGSTDVTWNATEDGTYSVRVGGTDCSTGTQVASGSYSTAPANAVTNVLASALSEGANTIRACVTDAATNTGSGTTSVSKDSTAPTVDVVSAVPSSLGASGSTNITWNANENGTYSIRVGGTDCATGAQVASGSYTTVPSDVITNILASQLGEGANTIRVCVTDAATNTGSGTTVVSKDTTAPTVTIVSVVPNPLQLSDTSTNVTWNANENGTYSIRVGGTNCSTGTQVASGSYTTSPANVVTNVLASSLGIGSNTIRLCLTDALANSGSATTTVTKNGSTPVFRSVASTTNAATGSISILKPGGVLLNDVLVATIDVIAAPAITAPLGWTLIRSDVSGTGATALRQSTYYRVVGLSEPALYTFTLASAHGASGAVLAYSGVDTTTPVEASSGATSATASLAAPSLTTTGANRMLVGLFGISGQRTVTPPSGTTERHELSLTAPAGEKVTSESADVVQAAAGASGVKTATASATGRGVGQLVALRPSGGSGPSTPVIDSVAINQSSPTTNQVLTATITSHDSDPGDVVSYAYQWKKNGSNVGTGVTLDLSVVGNGDRGDSITLQVTGSDGARTSPLFTSAAATVVNSTPTVSVALNTLTPGTNALLTAIGTASDADGDSVTITYVWKVNGGTQRTTVTSALSDTLDLSLPGNGDDGDAISIDLSPSDGVAVGAPASAAAAVGSPPLGSITEFSVPPSTAPSAIAAGPDGNIWFAEEKGNTIVRITPAGQITEFPLPTPSAGLGSIAAGPDGNLWFTEYKINKIGRITPNGVITEFPVPTPSSMGGITAGPDGNLWFTEVSANKIARITTSGAIVEFPVPTPGAYPRSVAVGRDGNIWFVELLGNKIAKITPAGVITEFPIPTASSNPRTITTGSDGNLWFTEFAGNKIGRATLAGQITEFAVPTASSSPVGIAAGPDGNVWFTEQSGNKIGRITPSGQISEFPVPTPSAGPDKIVAGPDGALWFTERLVNKIGRLSAAAQGASYVLSLDAGFTPQTRSTSQGYAVQWSFGGATSHTVSDASGLGLFDSGAKPIASLFSFTFGAAGSYAYLDTLHPAITGTVLVPIKAAPTSGTTSTVYAITWATAAANAPYVYDVEVAYCAQQPCNPVFTPWRTGVVQASAGFDSGDAAWQGAGSYLFRSRLRHSLTAATSGYSPTLSITAG